MLSLLHDKFCLENSEMGLHAASHVPPNFPAYGPVLLLTPRGNTFNPDDPQMFYPIPPGANVHETLSARCFEPLHEPEDSVELHYMGDCLSVDEHRSFHPDHRCHQMPHGDHESCRRTSKGSSKKRKGNLRTRRKRSMSSYSSETSESSCTSFTSDCSSSSSSSSWTSTSDSTSVTVRCRPIKAVTWNKKIPSRVVTNIDHLSKDKKKKAPATKQKGKSVNKAISNMLEKCSQLQREHKSSSDNYCTILDDDRPCCSPTLSVPTTSDLPVYNESQYCCFMCTTPENNNDDICQVTMDQKSVIINASQYDCETPLQKLHRLKAEYDSKCKDIPEEKCEEIPEVPCKSSGEKELTSQGVCTDSKDLNASNILSDQETNLVKENLEKIRAEARDILNKLKEVSSTCKAFETPSRTKSEPIEAQEDRMRTSIGDGGTDPTSGLACLKTLQGDLTKIMMLIENTLVKIAETESPRKEAPRPMKVESKIYRRASVAPIASAKSIRSSKREKTEPEKGQSPAEISTMSNSVGGEVKIAPANEAALEENDQELKCEHVEQSNNSNFIRNLFRMFSHESQNSVKRKREYESERDEHEEPIWREKIVFGEAGDNLYCEYQVPVSVSSKKMCHSDMGRFRKKSKNFKTSLFAKKAKRDYALKKNPEAYMTKLEDKVDKLLDEIRVIKESGRVREVERTSDEYREKKVRLRHRSDRSIRTPKRKSKWRFWSHRNKSLSFRHFRCTPSFSRLLDSKVQLSADEVVENLHFVRFDASDDREMKDQVIYTNISRAETWTVQQVVTWLSSRGLTPCIGPFVQAQINGFYLLRLTKQDVKRFNFGLITRLRLLSSLSKLKSEMLQEIRMRNKGLKQRKY